MYLSVPAQSRWPRLWTAPYLQSTRPLARRARRCGTCSTKSGAPCARKFRSSVAYAPPLPHRLLPVPCVPSAQKGFLHCSERIVMSSADTSTLTAVLVLTLVWLLVGVGFYVWYGW